MFFKIIFPSVNRSGLTANIEIKELNIMLGLYGGEDLDVIFNTVIFISKILSKFVSNQYYPRTVPPT
jgi:hypothetical protein